GGARPGADRPRHRRAPGPDAVEVSLLAHVRLANERPARGRVRRAGGGGAARTGARGRNAAGAVARPAAEVRRLDGGEKGGAGADADRVAGLPDVRRPAWRLGDLSVPDPRAPARAGRRGRAGRSARLGG